MTQREQHIAAIREATIQANPEITSRGQCHASCRKRFPDAVRLADVVLMMHHTLTSGKYDDAFGFLFNFGGLHHWNPRTDDIEQQSDETIAFIHALL